MILFELISCCSVVNKNDWLKHWSIYGLGSGGHGRLDILNPIPSSFLLQLELKWIVAALLGTPFHGNALHFRG